MRATVRTIGRGAMVAVLVAALAMAACGGSRSVLTEAEATAMLEGALHAWNSGDYEQWSRDWSRAMKRGIPADAFTAFREERHAATGDFVRIRGVQLRSGVMPGVVRWVADAEFERADVEFAFSFKEDGRLVEGAFMNVVE